MKKRICFVGFADAQLKALKHTVSGISNAWECVFVATGSAALEALASGPYDVVVANMHMARMNGAELLHKVGQKYPKTLRFIVGDVADQEIIINCIGGTHQFIAQPCEPHILISTIQRSLALDVWLSSEQLRAIVPKLRRLPSLPSTYFEVLKQVESPNTTVQSVGDVIARDPAATARLLQMVNSAAFAFSEKITDPAQAVALLGMETVKSLVLCLQVFSQDDAAKQAGVSFNELWEYSFAVATIAREITLQETGHARTGDEAFTAGLLHDVGRIVIAANLPKEYAAVISAARANTRHLHEEEVLQLGVSHAQVGAYLLGVWGMPATVVEAAALHHTPCAASTPGFSLLTAVHVANVFAYEQSVGPGGLARPELDAGYIEAIGLTHKVELWRANLDDNASEETDSAPPKPIEQPVAEAPQIIQAQPQTPRRGRLAWLFVSAAAAIAIVVIALASRIQSGPNDGINAEARTVDHPAVTTPSAADTTGSENTGAPLAVMPTDIVPAGESNSPTPATLPSSQNDLTSSSVPAVAPLNTAPAPTDIFASVKIQGVIYREGSPVALINGKVLSVGDRINGLKVVAIEPTKITLSSGDEQKVFVLK